MSEPTLLEYQCCPYCGADCQYKDMEKGGSCFGVALPMQEDSEECFLEDGRSCNHACYNEAHQ